MWKSRMFWRLFGTFSVLVLVAIAALATIVTDRLERDYLRQVEESLHTKALLIREALRDRPADYAAGLQSRVQALRHETEARITLLADDGRVLVDSDEEPAQMENHADRPEVLAARETGFGSSVRFSNTLKQSMMYAALKAPADSGGVGYVRVALPLRDVQGQLAGLRRLVWTAAALTGLAVLVLAFLPARRLSQPLHELVRGAERLAAGEHFPKIDVNAPDEVGTLARSFNALSDQLAAQLGQIEAERQQLRAILGSMVEGVVALDDNGGILFMNERAAELLLELSAPTATGRKFGDVVPQSALQDVVRRALSEPEPRRQELTLAGPAPRHITVHATRLPGGVARGAVLVLHDTTELRRLERMRQDFVANVSHELKTPLAVIKASLETLQNGALEDPAFGRRFLERAASQADRLQTLILDLLSLARIESGDALFDFQPVPLAEVVADCLERHREQAENKNQVLAAVVPPADGAVWADEEAVRQILDNLVDNALKYTPEGGRIRVRWQPEGGQVRLDVEDTGIGIPEADLPRVFERFYRVDKARSRELGGTGLGLAIVKHLAQAMHGSVGVASRVGQGSTFTVRLPRAPAGAA